MSTQFTVREEDIHPHLQARMTQRGVTREEIERTLNEGWNALDVRPGTLGKVLVITFQADWEGQYYEEKEVSVYYKLKVEGLVIVTVKARYGKRFLRGGHQ